MLCARCKREKALKFSFPLSMHSRTLILLAFSSRSRPPSKAKELSRQFKKIARARIRQFESDMPSQAVRLRRVDRVGAVAPANQIRSAPSEPKPEACP